MASFGGFLQGLGLAYGNAVVAGTQLQRQQADLQLEKAQADMAQQQAAQMRQRVQTSKDLGAFIQSQSQLEGADASNPLNQAKMYTKAAGLAASQGDFTSAEEMSKLADNANNEARTAAAAQLQQQQIKKEDLANTADTYSSNPSPQGAQDLVRKAIAAGVNPATIPLPNSPAFGAWVNQQKLAGMTSASRAQFVQKASDLAENRNLRLQEHQDNMAMRQATLQSTAAYRDAMLDLRKSEIADRQNRDPKIVTIGSSQYEFDPNSSMKGDRLATDPRYVKVADKTSVQQQRDTTMIAGAAGEAVNNLQRMTQFQAGTTQSPFMHLTDHDATSSVVNAGTNALTPGDVQKFQASSSGLSLELARIITAGGGRGANQAQINEMQKTIQPAAGDTVSTAMYKMATAAQMALTRMQNQPPPTDKNLKAQWDKNMNFLASMATPEQILDTSRGKARQQIENMQGSYQEKMDEVSSQEGLPGTGDVGAGTNNPPVPPSNIQSLVDKYRTK